MTKRSLALAVLLAVAIGGCGDDSGNGGGPQPDGSVPAEGGTPGEGGVTPGPDGSMLGPDGQVPNNPEGGMQNPEGGVQNPDGGPQAPASAPIGKAGGTLTSADGRLTIVFPRGALTRPAGFSVAPLSPAPTLAPIGSAYAVAPQKEALAEGFPPPEVRVTFKYQGLELGGAEPKNLVLAQWDGTDWDPLTTRVFNPSAGTITAVVTNLNPIGLIGGLCQGCKQPTCGNAESFDPLVNCRGGTCDSVGGCKVCRIPCDADGDGYCNIPVGGATGGDCADNDPTRYPNAPELLNGVDDNCNTIIDDGVKPCSAGCVLGEACQDGICVLVSNTCPEAGCKWPLYEQAGVTQVAGRCHAYGVENAGKKCVPSCDMDGDELCTNPGFNQPGGDCDDANPDIGGIKNGQAQPEICGDNLDNDCRNGPDDGCISCTSDDQCPSALPACVLGICSTCPTTCNDAACAAQGSGATCKKYGKGGDACGRCSPSCDTDGDGYCITAVGNFAGGDCAPEDAKRHPPEIVNGTTTLAVTVDDVCGNNADDDCNNFADDGCKECSTTAECPTQLVCEKGHCEVCTTSCPADGCVFGRDFATPPMYPGIAGRCFDRGNSCGACVAPCDADGDGQCTNEAAAMGATMAGNRVQPNSFIGGDCDDTKADTYKDAPEICGDSRDNDCDLKVDEECNLCAMSAMCGPEEYCSTLK